MTISSNSAWHGLRYALMNMRRSSGPESALPRGRRIAIALLILLLIALPLYLWPLRGGGAGLPGAAALSGLPRDPRDATAVAHLPADVWDGLMDEGRTGPKGGREACAPGTSPGSRGSRKCLAPGRSASSGRGRAVVVTRYPAALDHSAHGDGPINRTAPVIHCPSPSSFSRGPWAARARAPETDGAAAALGLPGQPRPVQRRRRRGWLGRRRSTALRRPG